MGRFTATSCFNAPLYVARFRHSLMRVFGLLAVASALNLATVQAADQADSKDKANRQNAVAGDRNDETGAIPESIRKLNLTDKQTDQIQKIIREYDVTESSVWHQFQDRYMQTIRLETSMLAAIEDQLTDTQRQKIRDHRRRTARHMKNTTSASDKPITTVKVDQPGAKSDQAGGKPAADAEVDLAHVGVSLTSDQEAHADRIHQKYRVHFKPLNREIHSLHNRLVALETEKLAEIEQVLTKEQLDQLRSNRQSASDSPKITLRVD